MTTVITHAVVGLAISQSISTTEYCYQKPLSRISVVAALLSIAPDLDVLSFRYGIAYGDHLGHRGFTHSIVFAILCSAIGLLKMGDEDRIAKWKKMLVFFFAVLSHPILDMLSNGGLGCAIFAPLSWQRYFMPNMARVIPVSPIGISTRVTGVLLWEVLLVWPFPIAWITSGYLSRSRQKYGVLSVAFCCSAIAVYSRMS